MKIQIIGKNMDVGSSLTQHVEEHLSNHVQKYFNNANEATITFHKEHHQFVCDIKIHVMKSLFLQSHGQHNDAYDSFNESVQHLAKRLRRYKKRIQHYHAEKPTSFTPMPSYILRGPKESDDEALTTPHTPEKNNDHQKLIIAEQTYQVNSFSVAEAVMHLELSHEAALLFKNSSTHDINMVYMRRDGSIGWVETASDASDT